ncbi:hypothetical protein EM308_13335 [Flavobacterium gilvum]|uniref:Uncharacterized protein n=1 Tax=Flavobacterium gilvum TaxID=1492737 RepID=A0AAC9I3W2_9FLAO|nr:hypothetical protein EM308_13335 [Flavobacterium gilvum]KFC59030.1 hypothetical protein FEM08_21620 [Flavobacterium gilvum]
MFCVFSYDAVAQNSSDIIHQNDIERAHELKALVLSHNADYGVDKKDVQNAVGETNTQDSFFLEQQVSFISVSIIIFVLAIVLKFLLLPEMNFVEDQSKINLSFFQKIKNMLMQPQFVLALIVLILYFYTASEILAGNSLGDFLKRLEVYVVQLDFYQKLILFTMTSIVIGCVLGIALIPKYVSLTSFLKLSCTLGVLLAVTILFISPCTMITLLPGIPELPVVIVLVAVLGFVNALFWPVIWSIVFRDFKDLL